MDLLISLPQGGALGWMNGRAFGPQIRCQESLSRQRIADYCTRRAGCSMILVELQLPNRGY